AAAVVLGLTMTLLVHARAPQPRRQTSAPPPSRPTEPVAERPALSLPPPPVAEEAPVEETPGPPREVAAQLEGARAAIRRAARACLQHRTGTAPPSAIDESAQDVKLRLRVTTQQQVAIVSDVERLDGRIADP